MCNTPAPRRRYLGRTSHKRHCNTLQNSAALYNTLQHPATHSVCNTPAPRRRYLGRTSHECWDTATHCNTLQHTATHCNTLHHIATHCSTLQHTATHCNTLQHTATHCNTLQHTAAHLHRVTDISVEPVTNVGVTRHLV